MRTLLLTFGILLPIISASAYIFSIVRGSTRPQRMTRFLLLIITALMTGSLWAQGDTSGIWLALVSFVQALAIWLLSLRWGMGGRSRLDFVCMGLCLSGMALWALSDKPWVGLIASIAADVVSVLPALRKTARWPHTELLLFYVLDSIAGLLVLLAGPLTLQAMLLPAYIAVINMVFAVVIRWPRRYPVLEREAV